MIAPVKVGCTCNGGKVYVNGIMPRPCAKCGGTGVRDATPEEIERFRASGQLKDAA